MKMHFATEFLKSHGPQQVKRKVELPIKISLVIWYIETLQDYLRELRILPIKAFRLKFIPSTA